MSKNVPNHFSNQISIELIKTMSGIFIIDHNAMQYFFWQGTIANVPPQGGRKHPEQEYIQINTKNILFICDRHSSE